MRPCHAAADAAPLASETTQKTDSLSTPLRRSSLAVGKVAHAVFTLVPLAAVAHLYGCYAWAWARLGGNPAAGDCGPLGVFGEYSLVWPLHEFFGQMLLAAVLAWPLLTLALTRADSRFRVWPRVAVCAFGTLGILVQALLDPFGVIAWWLS